MLTLTFKKKLASPCLEPATQSLVRNSESLAVLPPTEIHQYFSKVSVCFECLLRFGMHRLYSLFDTSYCLLLVKITA